MIIRERLDKCPICGRLPKIKLTTREYEYTRCIIKCKPLLGKLHLYADMVGDYLDNNLVMTTAELWNHRAEVQREAIENCKKLGVKYEG